MVRGKWQSGHCCRVVTAVVGVLVTILLLVPATAQTTYIFWTDRVTRKIQRADTDGTSITDLFTGIHGLGDIAVDGANSKVYWTIIGSKIERANLDGTEREDVKVVGAYGIALDVPNDHIYWAENASPGKIGRANLDGSNSVYVISGDNGKAKYPHFLALDLTNNKVYYRSNIPPNVDYRIKRANLDGSGVQDRVNGLFNQGVEGIALDVAGGKIYWTGIDNPQKIRRANLDGTGKQDLVAAGKPMGIALDLGNNKIYWADEGANRIRRANLDGTGAEDIVTGLNGPIGITIATIAPTNGGPSVDGSSSGTDDIRYVPFKSKYFLMALVALLGGWWVYRRC